MNSPAVSTAPVSKMETKLGLIDRSLIMVLPVLTPLFTATTTLAREVDRSSRIGNGTSRTSGLALDRVVGLAVQSVLCGALAKLCYEAFKHANRKGIGVAGATVLAIGPASWFLYSEAERLSSNLLPKLAIVGGVTAVGLLIGGVIGALFTSSFETRLKNRAADVNENR